MGECGKDWKTVSTLTIAVKGKPLETYVVITKWKKKNKENMELEEEQNSGKTVGTRSSEVIKRLRR